MSFVVAIDGPAAAGKGTVSKAVATHFGFWHLDTGLLYRGVGKKTLAYTADEISDEVALQLAKQLSADDLMDADLRTAEVAQAASRVAVIPAVRQELIEFQRNFANHSNGAVLDGRDIGTVICPDAQVKLFVTASSAVRANRRFMELSAKGHDVTPEGVLADVVARDKRDAERENAPMKQADDAVLIDTSLMTIDQAVARAIELIEAVQTR